MRAVILAGSRSNDPLAREHKVPSKAHIQVAGRSMLGRVLKAADSSEFVSGITVIGLENFEHLERNESWPPVQFTDGAQSPTESILRALSSISAEQYPMLITTCDHALLNPEIIAAFVKKSNQLDADLTVALASQDTIETAYPNVKRTYLKFSNGMFSSCNLFCLKSPSALKVIDFWKSAETDRKKPWRIAWRFGAISAARLLIKRPSLTRAFDIISRQLDVKIAPVELPHAEAAIDVDKSSDLELVERILREQEKI